MEAYSYVSSGGGMGLLLMILGALMVYLLFSKGFWMDRFMKSNKWEGEDVEPDYQEKIPFTPALEKPFDDPEVPNRPSKTKKKKVAPKGKKPKKKRIYKRRKKK